MKRWVKFIVTAVLAASIPLQGVAAATMPLCSMSAAAMNSAMAMSSSTMDKGMLQNQPCDESCQECCVPQNSNPVKNTPSQKCFVCYLGAIQVPVAFTLTALPEVATRFPPLISEHYQTFLPGLYRPPKSLPAARTDWIVVYQSQTADFDGLSP